MFAEKRFQRIPLVNLQVDSTYQRPASMTRVTKAARNFNPELVCALQVSKRSDGSFWLLDGQHRKLIMQEALALGTNSDDHAWCEVHVNLTLPQEAKLFAEINNGARKPTQIQTFRARLAAQEDDALAIVLILKKWGWRIAGAGEGRSFGVIDCTTSIEKGYRLGLLDPAMEVIYRVWGVDTELPDGFLGGVVKFLHQNLDRTAVPPKPRRESFDLLINWLISTGKQADELRRDAQGGLTNGGTGVTKLVADMLSSKILMVDTSTTRVVVERRVEVHV